MLCILRKAAPRANPVHMNGDLLNQKITKNHGVTSDGVPEYCPRPRGRLEDKDRRLGRHLEEFWPSPRCRDLYPSHSIAVISALGIIIYTS